MRSSPRTSKRTAAERVGADSDRSVFINCPFDLEYEPNFDALVFTTVCCGFRPRSSLETGSVSTQRMDRILQAIFSSKYSIHDLSRCQGEGSEVLARFNMPLELGMAMGRRFRETHDWLVLVPADRPYVQFVSDLAGFDLKKYDGKIETIVPRVMSWLTIQREAIPVGDPPAVLAAVEHFREAKALLKQTWAGEIPWDKVIKAATAAVPQV